MVRSFVVSTVRITESKRYVRNYKVIQSRNVYDKEDGLYGKVEDGCTP